MRLLDRILFAAPSPLFVVENPLNSSDPNSALLLVSGLYGCTLSRASSLPADVFTVLYYAALNSSRISEILTLTPDMYIGHGRFVRKAAKHGRSYVVYCPVIICDPDWQASARVEDPFIPLTYRQVWKACRAAGIAAQPDGRKNAVVTHGHRYQTAQDVFARAGETAAGDVLHHASRRSIRYYLNRVEV